MRDEIQIAGGDTATPRNLQKRVDLISGLCGDLHAPRMLDCGCGAGDYVRALGDLGWEAQGIEYLEDKVARARETGLTESQVARGDLEHLPYEASRFDVLLFNEVLEHVPDDRRALAEAHRVLKENGRLLVFSPNRLYPFESHGVFLKGSDRKLPVWTPFVPWVPTGLGRKFLRYWARNYWPSELRKLITGAGFSVVGTSYVWQTFEGISGSGFLLLRAARPVLRPVSLALEKVPGLRAFGVSQFIYATKRV